MIDVGKSMADVRISNRAALLKLLYARGELSRKQLAGLMNLTPATITNIAADLIDEQVLAEGPAKNGGTRSGRREVALTLNLKRFRVMCAYIAERKVAVYCMDLEGEEFFHADLGFDDRISGAGMVNSVCDHIQEYLNGLSSEARSRIIGIGMGIKGVFDPVGGVSIRSFGLWEDNLNVREIVESRFDFKVHLNNNVRCIANAQKLIHHNNGVRSLLFIKYGPLIGGALIMNGALFDGHGCQAMEVGHTVVDPGGPVCRCGKRGCLETIIGFDVMGKLLELQYSRARTPILHEITGGERTNIGMESILAAYDRGDQAVVDTVNRAIEYLALELINTIVIINPELIVLYGRPFESGAFLERLEGEVRRIGGESRSTVIMKSQSNLRLDRFGCASIVVKDFLDTGAVLTRP
ncbi:MAG: ROK family protein [Planctomycetota bacterium]|nr:ROK family protein [Planctomycetota bacterium]